MEEPDAGPADGDRIRVLLLEDEKAVAQGLAWDLERHGCEVVGTARDVDEAVLMTGARKPAVVVASIMVGDPNRRGSLRPTQQVKTLDLPGRLGAGGPPVLWFSGHGGRYALAAVQAGGFGYVSKETASAEDLAKAIRKAAEGKESWLPRDVREARAIPRPTDRQLEVLVRAAGRQSNAEIGAELFLSERTIESRIRVMLDKYRVNDRLELLDLADRMGWI